MNHQRLEIATSLILSLALSITSETPAQAKLVTGLWDSQGKMLIPAEYDEIRREGDKFSAYKSHLTSDGKITWTKTETDSSGHRGRPEKSDGPPQSDSRPKPSIEAPPGWRLGPNYDFGYSVSSEKGENGFVDRKGKLTVFQPDPAGTSSIEPIGPGLFLKNDYPGNGGDPVVHLLDSDLHVISELPRDLQFMGEYYKDGLLKVSTKAHVIAFLNEKGQFQIKPTRISRAEEFKNGLCKVVMEGRGQSSSAVIDRNGVVVAGPFEDADFYSGLDDEDQVILQFKGKQAGVITLTGKEILPVEFDSITEHDGQYVAHKNDQCMLFSHEGKELLKFPPSITDAFPTGNYIIFIEKTATQKTAKNSSSNQLTQRSGVMDRNGKVVIPAQFPWSGHEIKNGLLPFYRSENSATSTGVLNVETKKVVLQPTPGNVTIKDGFIFVSKQDDVFDPAQFKQQKGRPAWSNFLRSYDLIGMPKSKVETLLGKPETNKGTPYARYGLECGTCYNTYRGVEIEYNSKDKAIGWRDVGRDKPEGWHRNNVVLVNNPEGQPLLVVPKKKAKVGAAK